jgi:hypothetical protein
MSGLVQCWFRLPPKTRALFGLATLLLVGAACLVAEGFYFRARASRVEGTVVGHGSRGRPVVAYEWGGQTCRHEETGPSVRLAVGDTIGVYVSPERPPATRLDWPIGFYFLPGWACLMPAIFFTAYGVTVAIENRSPNRARSNSLS